MKNGVKGARAFVLLTQLGLSVALPLAGFILSALWLQGKYGLGDWVLVVGIILGFVGAVDGFVTTLKAVDRLYSNKDKKSKGDNNGYTHIHHS